LSLAADADTVPGAATASVTPPAAPGVAGAPATLPPVANTAAGSATLSSVAEQAVTPGNGGVTGTPAAAVLASGQPLLLAREQRVAAAGPGVGGLASDGTAAPSAAVAPLLPQPALGTAGMPADATALPVALVAPEAAAAVPAASALVSLVQTPGGAQRLTLRLQPPELGQVQIQIDRPSDAPARVEITVQRPETLTLLLRDQPQLQRALDQAGVPPDGRSLTFHVSPPTGSSGNGAGGPGSFAGSGGGADSSGSGGQNAQAEMDDAGEDAAAAAVPVPQRWLRAGLDITA
jgi:hypothetical protein